MDHTSVPELFGFFLVFLAGVLDRVRGGGVTVPVPVLDKVFHVVFGWFGFGFVLGLLASGFDPLVAALVSVGMWGGSKLGGWTGPLYRIVSGDKTVAKEWWQKGPLAPDTVAMFVRGVVWGVPGAALAWFLAPNPGNVWVIPAALGVGNVFAPWVVRWTLNDYDWFRVPRKDWFFSKWGVMEFLRGLVAGGIVFLSTYVTVPTM